MTDAKIFLALLVDVFTPIMADEISISQLMHAFFYSTRVSGVGIHISHSDQVHQTYFLPSPGPTC